MFRPLDTEIRPFCTARQMMTCRLTHSSIVTIIEKFKINAKMSIEFIRIEKEKKKSCGNGHTVFFYCDNEINVVLRTYTRTINVNVGRVCP